jgi:hypothetical protein
MNWCDGGGRGRQMEALVVGEMSLDGWHAGGSHGRWPWWAGRVVRMDGRTPRGSIIDIKAATSQKRVLNSLGRNNLYDA